MTPDPEGEVILPMGKIWDAYQTHVANDTVFQSLMSSLSQVADLHEQLDTLRSERDAAERDRDRMLSEWEPSGRRGERS